jgi:LPS export ABC transporter protein LptC
MIKRMRELTRYVWLLAASSAACGGSPQEPASNGDFFELPADQVMTDVTFLPTNGGIATALLRSDSVYMAKDSARYDLVGVDLQIFDETGQLSATLTSTTGEYSTNDQAMVARGNVVLITVEEQRRIETEELHYDPSSRRIWSDLSTVMHTRDGPIRGTAFTADDGFVNVNITGYRGPVPGVRMEF